MDTDSYSVASNASGDREYMMADAPMRSLEEIRQLVLEKSVGEILRRGKGGGGASLGELQLLASATGVAVYQNKENLAVSLKRKICNITTPYVVTTQQRPNVPFPTFNHHAAASASSPSSSSNAVPNGTLPSHILVSSSSSSATPVAAASASATTSATASASTSGNATAVPSNQSQPRPRDLSATPERDEAEEATAMASKKRKMQYAMAPAPKEPSTLAEVIADALVRDPVHQTTETFRRAAADYLMEREIAEVVSRIEELHAKLNEAGEDHPVRKIWEAELKRFMQKYKTLSKALNSTSSSLYSSLSSSFHPAAMLAAPSSSPDAWSRMHRIRSAYQAFLNAAAESV